MSQQQLSPTATTANVSPIAQTDGLVYADAVPLTSTEADLRGGDGAQIGNPIPTQFGEAIAAVIQLAVDGIITGNSTYVVMQMDMGDGVWIDMNWLFWNGHQGGATFLFSNGIAGATTYQQSRQVGQVPVDSSGAQGNGNNQLALGGRIRFVGKTVATGGSSSTQGSMNQVSATITYRLQTLR